MKKFISVFLAVICERALSIVSSNSVKYARWNKPMKALGYAWEARTVKTEDNYQLTLFHVIGSD